MLITVLSFGCNWWGRPGNSQDDPYRYTRRAAYFNSTGILCGKKIRRHWLLDGLIRFNGVGDFDPHHLSRNLGRTFHCSGLETWAGGKRLLLQKHVKSCIPDWYLATILSEEHGTINFGCAGWKSSNVIPVAISQLRNVQESMLLMRVGEWVTTNCGRWLLELDHPHDSKPTLKLTA